MRELSRWYKDYRGISVHVIRWEPDTRRVIYLRENYGPECFSPIDQFRRKFRKIEGEHEHSSKD
ncbi:DUF4222 domain-containing protein [Klebsiella sp. PL-2018]|uniref:DUF4222 domain-containing protein n=1 Tax=Klebsiella sp. PL-2018 TaxID=2851540 RepID=UPI001C220A53|nr:DUF4222 domain-containing protein [Klebsiella sp. PL-2018]